MHVQPVSADAVRQVPSRHVLDHRVPPPVVVLGLAVAMWGVAHVTPIIAVARLLRLSVGWFIVAVGIALLVASFRTFQRARTTIDPVHPDAASTMITTGPFRVTRNPMYVAFTIMLVGWAVALAAPWALVGPLVFALFTHRFQILPEERAMRLKFGAPYDAYAQRVPRWL